MIDLSYGVAARGFETTHQDLNTAYLDQFNVLRFQLLTLMPGKNGALELLINLVNRLTLIDQMLLVHYQPFGFMLTKRQQLRRRASLFGALPP